MKSIKIKFIIFFKNLIFFFKPHFYLGSLKHFSLTFSNTLYLSKWISQQSKAVLMNDFFTWKRDHTKRYQLYNEVLKMIDAESSFNYLEFGVYRGESFRWWLENAQNKENKYWGFDTFEGLPEDWGVYKKGEMSAEMPHNTDSRGMYVKGLFHQSLPEFLKKNELNPNKRNIIHLDADLFSSTLMVLSTLAPYLKKGDILFFDEFNVPNHEFFAYKIFTESFYVKTKLLGAVNNYYQVAMMIE
jgi:O-methyltransferase